MDHIMSYRESVVTTADGTRLVVLAYDGAIGFLRKARAAVEEGRPVEAAPYIFRAQKIVAHLLSSLNPAAGEISHNLKRLYAYVIERLGGIALSPAVAPLDDTIGVLEELRSAWAQIAERDDGAPGPRPNDLSVCA